MKFSIESDGEKKEYFFSFREAAQKTGLPKATILRVVKSGRGSFTRRSDKKVFRIEKENDGPFIQIDGVDFSDDEEIEKAFGWSREIFYRRLLRKGGKYFEDRDGEIHKVTWKSDDLEKIIDETNFANMFVKVEKFKSKSKHLPERIEKTLAGFGYE